MIGRGLYFILSTIIPMHYYISLHIARGGSKGDGALEKSFWAVLAHSFPTHGFLIPIKEFKL